LGGNFIEFSKIKITHNSISFTPYV
jgi:hypothetical protein